MYLDLSKLLSQIYSFIYVHKLQGWNFLCLCTNAIAGLTPAVCQYNGMGRQLYAHKWTTMLHTKEGSGFKLCGLLPLVVILFIAV